MYRGEWDLLVSRSSIKSFGRSFSGIMGMILNLPDLIAAKPASSIRQVDQIWSTLLYNYTFMCTYGVDLTK